jgi:hypothetical protein
MRREEHSRATIPHKLKGAPMATLRHSTSSNGAALAIGAAAAIAAAAALGLSSGSRSQKRYKFPRIERSGDGRWKMWSDYKQNGVWNESYVVVDPFAMRDAGVDVDDESILSDGLSYILILDEYLLHTLRLNDTRRVRKVLEDSIIEIELPEEFPSEDAGRTVHALIVKDDLLSNAAWLDNTDIYIADPAREVMGVIVNDVADREETGANIAIDTVYELLSSTIISDTERYDQIRNSISGQFENDVRRLDADEYPPVMLALMLREGMIEVDDISKETVRESILKMPPDELRWMFQLLERNFKVRATIGGERRIMLETLEGSLHLDQVFGLSSEDRRKISKIGSSR